MLLTFEDRPSESPLVERVWRSRTTAAGVFTSVAASHWEMVVVRLGGRTSLIVRGPETRPTPAVAAADGEWIGIRFKLGTFMPQLPAARVIDRKDVTLPEATKRSFWLGGFALEYPTFENAEAFVRRLVSGGWIGRDEIVDDVVRGRRRDVSVRSLQRRFFRSTGLSYAAHRQIERARHATSLLRSGVPILDVVESAGYFDQPHLTRSLKRWIGQTPRQVARGESQLSFLYKTRAE